MLEFCTRLRECRLKMQMTQKELATKAGIATGTLSAYETGAKKPSVSVAAQLADALEVSLDWLCGRESTQNDTFPKTYGELFRMLIRLHENSSPRVMLNSEEIEFDEYIQKYHPKMPEEDQMFLVDDYTSRDQEGEEYFYNVSLAIIIIRDDILASFFKGWNNIENLHNEKIIDDEMYQLWIDKRINTEGKIPINW